MAFAVYVRLFFLISTCGIVLSSEYGSGKIYRYSYFTELSLNEPPSSTKPQARRNTGLKMESTIKMSILWAKGKEQLFKLTISDAKLFSATKSDKHIGLKKLSHHPVYFSREGGKVTRVYVKEQEDQLSLNIKNGIISLFQYQNTARKDKEVDTSGECDVVYHVDRNIVTKSKSGCSNLEITRQYKNANKLLNVNIGVTSATTYDLSGGVIKTAATTEKIVTRLIMRKQMGMLVQQRQHLVLEDDQRDCPDELPGRTFDEAVTALKKQNLLNEMMLSSDVQAQQCGDECVKASDLVAKYRDVMYKDNLAKIETAKVFLQLLESFRYVNQEEVREILDDPDNFYSIPELIDVAVASQNSAAQDALMKFITFDDPYEEDIPERYLFAAAMSTHPSEKMLEDLLHIAQSDPKSEKIAQSVLLALGAVVHTYCRVGACDAKVVSNIREYLEQKLNGCKVQECRVQYLRALGNAGLQESIPLLLQYGEGHSEQETCTTAIQALRRMDEKYIDNEVKQILLDIFHQIYRNYSASVKLAALEILLDHQLTIGELRNIILVTLNREDLETSKFIFERLTDAAKSNQHLRNNIAEVLKSKQINNYDVLSYGGKSSVLSGLIAATKDVDIMFHLQKLSGKGGLIKQTFMDFNLQGRKYNLPLMSIGLYTDGLESFLEDSEEEESETAAEEVEPRGGMGLQFMDVQLRPIEFFNGRGSLMSAVWSAPSSPVSALQGNILLHDFSRLLRLQNGLIINLDLKSGLSFDLSGAIEISLWNRNAHSVVRSSGAYVIQGSATIDASIFKTGLEFTLESEAFMDFVTDVEFYEMPQKACLQMNHPDFDYKYVVTRYETLLGKEIHKSSAKFVDDIQPRSFPLDQHNSDSCRALFSEDY